MVEYSSHASSLTPQRSPGNFWEPLIANHGIIRDDRDDLLATEDTRGPGLVAFTKWEDFWIHRIRISKNHYCTVKICKQFML